MKNSTGKQNNINSDVNSQQASDVFKGFLHTNTPDKKHGKKKKITPPSLSQSHLCFLSTGFSLQPPAQSTRVLLQSIIDGCDRKNKEKENFLISDEASTVPHSSILTPRLSEYINNEGGCFHTFGS